MDRDAIWVGPDPLKKRGSFRSCPLKTSVSHCGVHCKKSITASARLLQPTALLPTGWCHINFSPQKSVSPMMRHLVKIVFFHFFLKRTLAEYVAQVFICPSRHPTNGGIAPTKTQRLSLTRETSTGLNLSSTITQLLVKGRCHFYTGSRTPVL